MTQTNDLENFVPIILVHNGRLPLKMSACKVTNQLKEASVTEARATPPTMGRRQSTTEGVGV